jgi:hypothetical protein
MELEDREDTQSARKSFLNIKGMIQKTRTNGGKICEGFFLDKEKVRRQV